MPVAGKLLFDRSGRIVYFDAAAESLFGWSSADVVGQPISTLIPDLRWEDAPPSRPGSPLAVVGREVEGLRNGGATFPLECSITCPVEGDLVFLAILRDVQADLRHDAEVAHKDRIMALGRLAAGIGHEIDNYLTYVLVNLEFVSRETNDIRHMMRTSPATGPESMCPVQDPATRLSELLEALSDAHRGAARIRDIVRDVKTFAHVDGDGRDLVQVSRALDAAIALGWSEIRPRARLVREYTPVPLVAASEGRLVQVFLNLLVNAAHAIGVGSPDSNEIRTRVACDGDRVIVEVADTGAGIEPVHLPRLFEPFFTTKPSGEGTGLGLSIAWEIVNDLRGRLGVRSELGKGSVFRVELPAAREDQPSSNATQQC